MSCFIVSDFHLNVLVQFWADNCNSDTKPSMEDCQQVGQALLRQNTISFNSRYPNHTVKIDTYVHKKPKRAFTLIEVIKLAQSYQYQSCEDEQYLDSRGWTLSQSIFDEAIRRLPGYEEAEWAI